MPFISSPVAYPPSSLRQEAIQRKRKRSPQREQSPSRRGANRVQNSVFTEDSDDEDERRKQTVGLIQDVSPDSEKENLSEPVQLRKGPANSKTNGAFRLPALASLGTSLLSKSTPVPPAANEQTSGYGSALPIRTTRGTIRHVAARPRSQEASYERMVASRSVTAAGKAIRAYYGIEVNDLLREAAAEIALAKETREIAPVAETVEMVVSSKPTRMWTEKYRPKKFTDLVGDDRTHRTVMHWLKAWDSIVFPGSKRPARPHNAQGEEREHRKVLLLTGPPGLGKTTLAHVCARQAGYEVTEINASDERSKDVVKGRIRDMLGTENVRSASNDVAKAAKPICLVVDEVDGVVSGSGGSGEGGFVKALIDLILLDKKNAAGPRNENTSGRKRKGDNFRMLRPLVMICNDAYHPALRPLRTSQLVEIIHCGRPAVDKVATRVLSIFGKEGVPADGDAVRKLCESCWGTTSKKEGGAGAGAGDGDIRSVLVMGEMLARRLRSTGKEDTEQLRLTKAWLQQHIGDTTASGGVKGLGRGGSREIVDRVFMEGAGLSKPASSAFSSGASGSTSLTSVKSVNEAIKAASAGHLRTLIDSHGETDRIMTDLYSQYPSQPYQDDTFLSKPAQAYNWLHFHDALSSAVYSSSEWELAPYLSSPALAFHHLFATSSTTRARHASDKTSSYSRAQPSSEDETHPFLTASASFAAHEREKSHTAVLQSLHESLSLPLTRLYPRPETMAAEFLPYLLRMLSPTVNPVLITSSTGSSSTIRAENNKTTASVRKASERALIDRSVQALMATGLRFDRHRVGFTPAGLSATANPGRSAGGFVYRMNLALDEFGLYETGGRGFGNDVAGVSAQGNRYAVRQVLVQECAAEERRRDAEARARRRGGVGADAEEEDGGDVGGGEGAQVGLPLEDKRKVKRDFFGRVVAEEKRPEEQDATVRQKKRARADSSAAERRVWVSYHEGYSNAVRKPITLAELMMGF